MSCSTQQIVGLINKDCKLIYINKITLALNSTQPFAIYALSTSIKLSWIPSAVHYMFTIIRPVWSLCDCAEVCMQSLEDSADCWQVDSL